MWTNSVLAVLIHLYEKKIILVVSVRRQLRQQRCVCVCVCTCFSARLPMIRFHFSMGESILPTFTCVGRQDRIKKKLK